MRIASAATKTLRAVIASRRPVGRCSTSTPRARAPSTDEPPARVSAPELEHVALAVGERAEDDVRAGPVGIARVVPRTRERHACDLAPAGQLAVIGRGQRVEDRGPLGRVDVHVAAHAQRSAPPATTAPRARRRDERDPLAVARTRAGAGPVCAHPADVGRERAVGKGVVVAVDEGRAGARAAGFGRAVGSRSRRRGLGAGTSDRSCARSRASPSRMFFTCTPGRAVSCGPVSSIRIRRDGSRSYTVRANAEPTGPLPTTRTSTALLTWGAKVPNIPESEHGF